MGYIQHELNESVGKNWTKIIIAILSLITVYTIFALIFSFFPFNVIAGVTNKVVNADSIISNYEWFYDMKGQIDATIIKYEIAKKMGKDESTGIRMVLESMIAEYNSKSKQITRNLWKSKDLPYQIIYKEKE